MGLFEVLEVWRVCCSVSASTRLEAQGLGGLKQLIDANKSEANGGVAWLHIFTLLASEQIGFQMPDPRLTVDQAYTARMQVPM